jgi:hypothetical protein
MGASRTERGGWNGSGMTIVRIVARCCCDGYDVYGTTISKKKNTNCCLSFLFDDDVVKMSLAACRLVCGKPKNAKNIRFIF